MLISIFIGLLLPSRAYVLVAAPMQAAVGVAINMGIRSGSPLAENFPINWAATFLYAVVIAAVFQLAAFEAKRWWTAR